MPIGSAGSVLRARQARSHGRRAWRHLYGRMYGCSDLHTHIRWRAIRAVIDPHGPMIDVGCGDGLITLELARRFPGFDIRGIDLDPVAIAAAEQTRDDLDVGNATFEVGDVSASEFGSVDCALLLDVLEHLPDESATMTGLTKAVRPGGRLVISTPTPNFPRFFGREFHEAVGHVRDGYTIEQVGTLLENAGFTVDSSRYYTRMPSSLVCGVYYRYLWKGKLGAVLSPVLAIASHLDALWPWRRGASSILVIATRQVVRADHSVPTLQVMTARASSPGSKPHVVSGAPETR